MATTSLFVEILVIGALAELWFVGALVASLPNAEVRRALSILGGLEGLAPIAGVLLLALTYAVGWVVNFVAERAFKLVFERPVRDRLFDGNADSYQEARARVLQSGSAELLQGLVLDRHVVRIARSNVFNFSMIAIVLLMNGRRLDGGTLTMTVAASVAVALISFAQWRTRYESHYKTIATTARVIEQSLSAPPNSALQPTPTRAT